MKLVSWAVLCSLLVAASVYGISKNNEAALREELQTARIALAKQHSVDAAALAKLTAAGKVQAGATKEQTDSVRQAQNANASTAADAVTDAKQANTQAVLAAIAAKAQANSLMIAQIGGVLVTLCSLYYKYAIDQTNHRAILDQATEAANATAAHRAAELAKIDFVQAQANVEAIKASASRHTLVAEITRLQLDMLNAEKALKASDKANNVPDQPK